jgi:hypothetical protein
VSWPLTAGPVPSPILDPVGSPFTYRSFDLTTGTELDSLPYQGVTFGRGPLNQSGSFAGSLPVTDPRVGWNAKLGANMLDWPDATRPGRTALIVDLFDVPIWGGIIWTRVRQKSKPVVQVGAMEFGSYFQSRLQADDYSTTWTGGGDPMLIAKQVIDDALAVSNNILGGIALTLNPSGGEGGPLITPSYPGTALQTIDSIMSILSQQGYTLGFDYSWDIAYTGANNTPTITLNLWYPRKGRTADQTQLVLLGKDCTDYYYSEDSTQQATRVTETGSGTGGVQPATAVAEDVESAGYPPLQRVFPRTTVNDDQTLGNIALGDLGIYCWPVVSPWFELPVAVPNAQGVILPSGWQFGQFDIGDDFLFEIEPCAGGGENIDPQFPQGMSFEWRINSWKVTPADKGLSTLHLDACIPPIATLPPPQPPG